MARLIMQPTAAVSDRLKTGHGIRLTAAVFAVVMLIVGCIFSPGTQIILGEMAETSAPTPAPGTKRTDAHGIAQVYVPAGCFMMGSTDEQVDAAMQAYDASFGAGSAQRNRFTDEQPPHQVCITQGYWIDAYEVTNAAYQAFIDASGYSTRAYWSSSGWQWKEEQFLTGPHDFDRFTAFDQPRVGITWYEAEAYAKWRGGHMPTEAEWEYAARGPDSLVFPWGNTWGGKKANAEYVSGRPAPVGSYESDKSWVGAYDLAGNACEWVADWYSDTYYQQQVKDDPAGPISGVGRSTRGGSFDAPQESARAANRGVNFPTAFWSCGFRIVSYHVQSGTWAIGTRADVSAFFVSGCVRLP